MWIVILVLKIVGGIFLALLALCGFLCYIIMMWKLFAWVYPQENEETTPGNPPVLHWTIMAGLPPLNGVMDRRWPWQ